jgi:hypothetical protein
MCCLAWIVIFAFWTFTAPSSGIDGCYPASYFKIAMLPRLGAEGDNLSSGFVTSGKGQSLSKYHTRDSCIGVAEPSSFDFQQQFGRSDSRNGDRLDLVLETAVSSGLDEHPHRTHCSPGVTTRAARMDSGSLDVIDLRKKACLYCQRQCDDRSGFGRWGVCPNSKPAPLTLCREV